MKVSLLFSFILIAFSLSAQINQTTITTLEEIEKEFKRWKGGKEKIKIRLISETNKTNKSTEKYLLVELSSSNVEEAFSSINLAFLGNLSAIGANSTYETKKYNGTIKVDKKYEPNIVAFLNETVHKNANPGQYNFSMNLNIDNRFTLSFVYDESAISKSKYYLQLDDAWFAISYDEGIAMLRKFITMLRQI